MQLDNYWRNWAEHYCILHSRETMAKKIRFCFSSLLRRQTKWRLCDLLATQQIGTKIRTESEQYRTLLLKISHNCCSSLGSVQKAPDEYEQDTQNWNFKSCWLNVWRNLKKTLRLFVLKKIIIYQLQKLQFVVWQQNSNIRIGFGVRVKAEEIGKFLYWRLVVFVR